jgi:hypothetical protein
MDLFSFSGTTRHVVRMTVNEGTIARRVETLVFVWMKRASFLDTTTELVTIDEYCCCEEGGRSHKYTAVRITPSHRVFSLIIVIARDCRAAVTQRARS